MAELQAKMKQLLTCIICLERYNSPKTLNCEHSFCTRCLQLLFRKNNGILLCPTCRYHQSDILKESLIENLPTSLHLKQTMELILSGMVSDGKSDRHSYEEIHLYEEVKDLKIEEDSISAEKRDDYSYTKMKMKDISYYDQDFENDHGSEEDDLKKVKDDTSDYVTESEDEEFVEKNISIHPKKKKRSIFSKLSKSVFGTNKVLEDIQKLEKRKPDEKNMDNKNDNESISHVAEDCPAVRTLPKTNSSLFCSFCNKTDHDLGHCSKASMATRQNQRRAYARTAALVGAGYLANSRPGSSSLLMNKHTPGVVGYNASQGMSRGRGLSTKKKPKPNRVSRTSATGRGARRGGNGKSGRSRGVVILM